MRAHRSESAGKNAACTGGWRFLGCGRGDGDKPCTPDAQSGLDLAAAGGGQGEQVMILREDKEHSGPGACLKNQRPR